MRLIAALLLFTFYQSGQQVGQNTPPGGNVPASFSSSTQLVIETVTVTDRNGSPVGGLTANDFVVTENGVPQTIRVFEHQDLPQPPSVPPTVRSEPEHIHIFDKLGQTHISPEASGKVRYKDRRLLALYFDMTAMREGEQIRALNAAKTFIRTQM